MANVRVYELARRLLNEWKQEITQKILRETNKRVLEVARGLGISVKGSTSSVSLDEAKKIENRINNSHSAKAQSQEPIAEQEEKVRVFKSESGAEVVERRKGGRVILRRKKKVIEEPEQVDLVKQRVELEVGSEQEEGASVIVREATSVGEKMEMSGSPVIEVEADNALVDGSKSSDVIEESEQGKGLEDASVGSSLDEERNERSAKEGVEDAGKKSKKKGKKAKPVREEIIDEDALEELRKAFRAKLPGRRREYLVEDRPSKNSPSVSHVRSRGRAFNKDVRKATGVRRSNIKGAESAEVIPFPSVKPGKRNIRIGESVQVAELAKLMGVKAGKLIKRLISLGVKATINQALDPETATIVAEDFGYNVLVDVFKEEHHLLEETRDLSEQNLTPRPPVVTVMGHVDHGKTTLLDSIRQTNVVEGEAGGITQHIGAYSVDVDGRKVSFIDTPGHEAFTAMRARGAKVTDVVVLVVAADDGVMPQTVEAVNHARSADVPIIVAINKIDKPEADKDKILRQLSEIGLVSEEWGGDALFAEVSAKRKTGIKELLDLILLQADILELRADSAIRANGFVVEAVLDKGRGPIATVLVIEGTLNIGDYLVAGTTYGKVRALINDKGVRVNSSGPSMPVEIMGLSGVPEAGERFYVVKDEKSAKGVVTYREMKQRERAAAKEKKPSLENLFDSLEGDEAKELALIIKADTQGSVEAIAESVNKLSTEKCQVKIIHTGVGSVSETDVNLASASCAVILGFNIRPDHKVLDASARQGISLELHTIIYEVIDRVRSAMEGLLDPILEEKITGHAEVKDTFNISKVGTIAGCMISDGKVTRDSKIRLLRDGVIVFDGQIDSLRRFKDDVGEVVAGFECGIGIKRFNDIKVGDTLEFHTVEEFKQEL